VRSGKRRPQSWFVSPFVSVSLIRLHEEASSRPCVVARL